MYVEYYGFTEEPFRLVPRKDCFFKHKSYRLARDYLRYGVVRGEGFILVIGRAGTGKSTLTLDLLGSFAGPGVRTARLVTTQLQAADLLKVAAYRFGLHEPVADKATLLLALESALQAERARGTRHVLIVDEAQNLSRDSLEELRLLTNLEHDGEPLVQIFLLGQESLGRIIADPAFEQLRQRVVACSHLDPMNAEESRDYIHFRLRSVGWNGTPEFSNEAHLLIWRFTRGNPRCINQFMSRLMLHGYANRRQSFDARDVHTTAGDLRREGLLFHDDLMAPASTQLQ